jgi:glycerol kinase
MIRAVLEGIAQRGADLVDAAQQELGTRIVELRVDGGMSVNRFLMQRLADFTGLSIAVSTEREATMRGVGLMALVSEGHLTLRDVEVLWSPAEVFVPLLSDDERDDYRSDWARTLLRAGKTIPELSVVEF